MASLTRKFLASIGLEEDKIDIIVEKHNEVLTEIKDERDKYKEEADKISDLSKENEELKAKVSGEDPYKEQYEQLKKEFDTYKQEVEAQATNAKKETAYRKVLKEIGIPDKIADSVMKVSDINKVELTEDDGIKDEEALKTSLREEWKSFIPTTHTEGANSANPPANAGKSTMTKEQIRAIADPIARQKAMAENPTLFGLPENN